VHNSFVVSQQLLALAIVFFTDSNTVSKKEKYLGSLINYQCSITKVLNLAQGPPLLQQLTAARGGHLQGRICYPTQGPLIIDMV